MTVGGTYSVVVTFGECVDTDSIVITGRDDLVVTLGSDLRLCPNETHTLTATTDETDVTYAWSLDGDILTGATESTLDIPFVEGDAVIPGTYEVTISVGACTGTASVYVDLYDLDYCLIPEGISPNGDQWNQNFDLEFINDRTGISKLQIFNRYGSLVYEKNNYVNEWEGQTDDGDELPTGTYFYVLDLQGEDAEFGRQVTGWVYLNRAAN